MLNTKLEEYKNYLKDKKVAVLGIGISNRPLITYLVNLGIDVTAFDKSDFSSLGEFGDYLKEKNVKLSLGQDYLEDLTGFDVIFRTPGMRPDVPQIVKAVEEGADLASEMEVFMELCPAQIIAITGSDGKTTTTTLISKFLEKQGYKVWLGGNIGTPLLCKIDEVHPADKVVLELSSFQLQTMKESPDIAVITNITPNHLDVHKSMEEYVEAKKNIFKYQNRHCTLVINNDNPITKSFISEAKGSVRLFSRKENLGSGAFYVKNGAIIYDDGKDCIELIKCEEIMLPGNHNIENYLAACAATIGLVLPENMSEVARTFGGVEHRLEFVREAFGVKYYNSSIDSSPNRTKAALSTFKQRVILIAGGKDKNIPYDELGPSLVEKVKDLILIGPTADKIEESLNSELEKRGLPKDRVRVHKCTSYQEIVTLAKNITTKGDIVLLSPASTSFDMFKNFEERGNTFKNLVMKL